MTFFPIDIFSCKMTDTSGETTKAKSQKGNTDDTSFKFKHLEPSTLYSFRVKYLANGEPISYVFNNQQVKFALQSPNAVVECFTRTKRITSLKPIDKTETSIRLEWNSHSKLPPNSRFLYYTIRYKNLVNSITDVNYIFKHTQDTNYTLNGLVEGTTYEISVNVETTDGSSLFSDTIYLTTLGTAPETPNLPQVQQNVVC